MQQYNISCTKVSELYMEADMQTDQVQGGLYSYLIYVRSQPQWLRAEAPVTARRHTTRPSNKSAKARSS